MPASVLVKPPAPLIGALTTVFPDPPTVSSFPLLATGPAIQSGFEALFVHCCAATSVIGAADVDHAGPATYGDPAAADGQRVAVGLEQTAAVSLNARPRTLMLVPRTVAPDWSRH